jgi:single-strand DNA-binding protein
MKNINRVTLIGYAGADAELSYTQKDVAMARVRLATKRSFKSGDEWKDETQWHNIVCWRNLAESAAMIRKGDAVYVEGSLTYRKYTGKDNVERIAASIEVSRAGDMIVTVNELKAPEVKGKAFEPPPPPGVGPEDDLPF